MQSAPQELLKQYVQSQHFTSTADIMNAMKEMFRDIIQQVMEVEIQKHRMAAFQSFLCLHWKTAQIYLHTIHSSS